MSKKTLNHNIKNTTLPHVQESHSLGVNQEREKDGKTTYTDDSEEIFAQELKAQLKSSHPLTPLQKQALLQKQEKAQGTLLFLDYDSSNSRTSSSQVSEVSIGNLNNTISLGTSESDQIKERYNNLGKRLHNIESLLWDNRDKYTTSLDIVANREIEICRALDETKKLLRENRELYTQAFQRLFAKEELLETMLKETKEILTENRKILMEGMTDLQRKNSESLEKIKEFGETGILLGKSRRTQEPLREINNDKKNPGVEKGMIL